MNRKELLNYLKNVCQPICSVYEDGDNIKVMDDNNLYLVYFPMGAGGISSGLYIVGYIRGDYIVCDTEKNMISNWDSATEVDIKNDTEIKNRVCSFVKRLKELRYNKRFEKMNKDFV